jgi:hypothetical protein
MFEATLLFVVIAATIAPTNNKFEDNVLKLQFLPIAFLFEGCWEIVI